MDLQTKRRAAQNAVYILSAVIVAAVVIMTLVTSVMRFSERDNEPPVTEAETEPYAAAPSEKLATAPPAVGEAVTEAAAAPASEESAAEIMAQTPEETVSEAVMYSPPVFVMPCAGIITRGFDDTIPVWSQTMDDYRVHTAIDISAVYGYEAVACSDGVITAVTDDPYYGVTVVIDHGDGLISRCSGLSQTTLEYVDAGRDVEAGELIGAVGECAGVEMVDEPHIHLSMSLNGVPVNPLSYIPYDESEAVMAYEDER